MYNSKRVIRFIALGCLFIMLLTTIGCAIDEGTGGRQISENEKSTPDTTNSDNNMDSDVEAEPPFEITVATCFYSAEVPTHEVFEEKLEDIANVELEITWIPAVGYEDKIHTMIASGSLPMVTVIRDGKASAFVEAARSGSFWELGSYLDDYPNISQMNKQVFDNIRIDGKLYGIYRERPLVREGFVYREDWLEKLGLSVPEKVSDFYQVFKAFKELGEYGFGESGKDSVPPGLRYINIWQGGFNGWGIGEDGKLAPEHSTETYKEAMDLYRQYYSEGLINKNFAELNSEEAKKLINTEESGFVFIYTDDIQNRFADLYKVNPDAKLWFSYGVLGDDGVQRAVPTPGFNGQFVMAKNAVKDEAKLKRVLHFIDSTAYPDFANLMAWGLEGEHYSLQDGLPARTQEQLDAYSATVAQYGQLMCFQQRNTLKGIEPEVAIALREDRKLYDPVATMNPSLPLISQTQIESGADLQMIINDAVNKYIMGVIDEAEWEKAKENWLKNGGQKIIDEYNEAYSRIN